MWGPWTPPNRSPLADMSIDPVAFKQTKHIMRAAAFLRDIVLKEATTLRHLDGDRMIADILTKAQSRIVFLQLCKLLNRGTPDLSVYALAPS